MPAAASSNFSQGISTVMLLKLPLLAAICPFLGCAYDEPIGSVHRLTSSHFSAQSHVVLLYFRCIMAVFVVAISLFFMQRLRCVLYTSLNFHSRSIVAYQVCISGLNLCGAAGRRKLSRKGERCVDGTLIGGQVDRDALFRR